MSKLSNVSCYVTEKISVDSIDISEYITTDNLLQNKKGRVIAEKLPTQKVTRFKKNDILIANIRPYLKKIWQADIDGGASSDVLVVRPNDVIDNNFLYYALTQDSFFEYVMKGSKGTKMPRGDKSQIMDFVIPNLEIDEQIKIGKLLKSIDQKIQINNQINQELEAMAKTIYDYWFVQFDFPDQNGKPYKSSGGKMVYHPELKREIPEGWGVESVGNLLDKVTKAEKIENNSIEFIGEIPVIDQSQKYIAGFTNNEKALLQPQDGHVIFGDHTRVVKYINFDYARGADGTQVLISNNENISNVLLYHMIEDFDLSNYGYARHFKFLKEKTVIVPDKEVSSKFETQANVIYEKIKNNIFENQELTQLRDWLLPMLMNGQVKVE
ncbi:restriction endonuclease subunit S [Streptococcus infantis]|uniref:restriction endonuclease subunit S n=1 Tax=Streptococcus infantis TaxID=68892 RepID=UPI0039C3AB91